MRFLKSSCLILGLAVPFTAIATPTPQGSYGDWNVYSRYDGAQRLCYVVADAKTKSPSHVRHGDIHFVVANWKSGAAFEQPSFFADFSLKDNNPPAIRIGNKNFPMYVSQNEAFVAENSDEKSLLTEMRAGSTMKVSAVSGRGTNVSYSFSLSGVTAALKKAKESCS